MKKVKYLFLILLSIFIIGCNKQEKILETDKITVKIGEAVPSIKDYIKEKYIKEIDDLEINWDNIKIEDNKIYYSGLYNGKFIYKKEEKGIILEVIDDEKPTIEGVKDIEIYEKDKVDLLKNIKANDNSHDKVDLKVEGQYDTNKKGEYKLKYIATDKSNNKEEKEFKLTVKERKKEEVKQENSNNKKQENKTNTTKSVSTTSKGYKIEKKNGVYYINGILIANKTYDLPSTYNPGLLKSLTDAFNKMKNDAAKENINLSIISGFRSYETQKTLYNNYVAKDGKAAADTYSARPGHSEHQTGLAIDVNSVYKSFADTKEGIWLNKNCYKYGFILRYPKGKESITGYMYEPWHIRYVGKDISEKLYNNGTWITLEEYLGITSKY